MADFNPAFEQMILREGGYRLHQVEGDRGGVTYAGIARRRNPDWEGWRWIDEGSAPPTETVRGFYRRHFWDAVRGDDLRSQAVASTIFDFAVNAGCGTARKLAQLAIGTTPDGIFGPVTMQALNAAGEELFILRYALAKLTRYRDIVRRDPSQRKFLLGWLNRTLADTMKPEVR